MEYLQVDAAYEEADKLTGGKQAQAVAQQDVAGATAFPGPAGAGYQMAAAPPVAATAGYGAATAAPVPPPGRQAVALPSTGNATADKVASGGLGFVVSVACVEFECVEVVVLAEVF